MTVYFILAEETARIKIGHTAGKVTDRLKSLQTASPCELRIVFEIPDAPSGVERGLHRRFEHLRIHREWFSYAQEIKDFLHSNISCNVLVASSLPDTQTKKEKVQYPKLDSRGNEKDYHPFKIAVPRYDIFERYSMIVDAALSQARFVKLRQLDTGEVIFGSGDMEENGLPDNGETTEI